MAAREREHITRAGHAADEETVVVDGAAYGRMLERAARVGLTARRHMRPLPWMDTCAARSIRLRGGEHRYAPLSAVGDGVSGIPVERRHQVEQQAAASNTGSSQRVTQGAHVQTHDRHKASGVSACSWTGRGG
jgi:hypothetical protein